MSFALSGRSRVGLLSAAVVVLACAPATAGAADWAPVDQRLEAAVTPPPGSSCDAAEACGISFSVQDRAGLSYNHAYGAWNLAEFAPIASASKWLTAATVLALVDEGRLDLDAPIRRYLDAVPAAASSITTRQLLSHTSGLTHQHPCLQDQTTTTLQACAASILQTPLLAKPGTTFIYGGGSIQVVGAIAERVSGLPWAQLFRSHIARPLEMLRTVYGGVTGTNFETKNPQLAGGASSTALDLQHFLRMILNGGSFRGRRILSPRAMAQFEHDNTANTTRFQCPTQPDCEWWDGEVGFGLGSPDGTNTAYGLGVWLYGTDEGKGERILTSPGAYGTLPWANLTKGYAGLIFMNKTARGFPNAKGIYKDLRPLVEARVTPPCSATRPLAVEILRSRLSRHASLILARAQAGGCATHTVRLEVALGRRSGRTCRWVSQAGRLGTAGRCDRPRFLRMAGSPTGRVDVTTSLRPGRYLVIVRATDAARNRASARRTGRIQ